MQRVRDVHTFAGTASRKAVSASEDVPQDSIDKWSSVAAARRLKKHPDLLTKG